MFPEIGWLAGFLYGSYGLLGLFLAAVIGNATIFLPFPIDLLVFIIGTVITDPYFLLISAVVASFGAAIGEMSAYILGLLGIKTIQRMSEERVEKILALGESLANKGIPIVFLGALTPFPFDFIGIAAGLLKYNPKKFFIAAFVGKAVRYIIIAFAGFIGAASVKAWFGI